MSPKSTNYFDTFIEIAEDCPVKEAEIPLPRGESKTVPTMQYEMITRYPYKYTQDDILFEIHAERKGIAKEDKEQERDKFFSKGQACLRASALPKRYGWGVHHNKEGKVALFAMESDEYQTFIKDDQITKLKAMRSKRN